MQYYIPFLFCCNNFYLIFYNLCLAVDVSAAITEFLSSMIKDSFKISDTLLSSIGILNENREPSTKGCIVMNNKDLLKLNDYIKINTNIFIFPEEFKIPIDDNKVSDILNESFIMELKDSVIAADTSTTKQRL